MEFGIVLALTIGVFVILLPVGLVWYLNISGIHEAVKGYRAVKLFKGALPKLACSIDTDCPPGYVCAGGRCVSQLGE